MNTNYNIFIVNLKKHIHNIYFDVFTTESPITNFN